MGQGIFGWQRCLEFWSTHPRLHTPPAVVQVYVSKITGVVLNGPIGNQGVDEEISKKLLSLPLAAILAGLWDAEVAVSVSLQ